MSVNNNVNVDVKLVAPVAGNPLDGTNLPREEKAVWREMCRVIHEMVQNMAEQGGYRLLIPIWNKFDLEFLRAAEKHGVPVTFILPFDTWGDTKLPKFQTDLVKRMKRKEGNSVIVHEGKNFTERVHAAIDKADLIVALPGTSGVEQFYPTMQNVPGHSFAFPFERMAFRTEEEAAALAAEENEDSVLLEDSAQMILGLDLD